MHLQQRLGTARAPASGGSSGLDLPKHDTVVLTRLKAPIFHLTLGSVGALGIVEVHVVVPSVRSRTGLGPPEVESEGKNLGGVRTFSSVS